MMYVWMIMVLSDLSGHSSLAQGMFGTHVKNYELVDCRVSRPREPRTKRNSQDNSNRSPKNSFDAEVRFKSYQTDFHLLLSEDTEFQNIKVESKSKGGTNRENVSTRVYDGVLRADSLESYAFGYLEDHTFSGYIASNKIVYFVEPASRFFPNLTRPGRIMVYREKDIDMAKDLYNNGATDSFSLGKGFRKIFANGLDDVLPKGIKKTDNENEEYACKIELVSDHTLYNFFQGDVNRLAGYLYLHAKYADFIFRRTDFDGDGKRDRIRIVTDNIYIYKSSKDPNYPMAESSDMFNFLKAFSLRTQNYCLSLCMSYRHSSQLIIGQAFKSSAKGSPGGICQKPIPFENKLTAVEKSLNTAVVTIQSSENVILPLAVSLLAVAHEFGHNFGSDHDRMDDVSCSPGGPNGFYVMHAQSQKRLKPLSSFFSPCSRKSIANVIAARGECLKPHPATCGNGVQEGDEDCDCGKEANCWILDRCCTPSDVDHPEKGCTFRASKGFVCSPKENLCCLRDCSVNRDTEFQCHSNDDDSCLVSYCDGRNASCPTPTTAPDRHPCQRTSKSCSGGACNSSVCQDNGLSDCICERPLQCLVCCRKADRCVTASSLGFFASEGIEHILLEGTPCWHTEGARRHTKTFQCDGSGKCINARSRQVESFQRSIWVWWAIGGLAFALLVVTTVLCYFSKSHVLEFC